MNNQILDEYYAYLLSHKKETVAGKYLSEAKSFFTFIQERMYDVAKVGIHEINNYKKYLSAKVNHHGKLKYRKTSIDRKVCYVKTFLSYLIETGRTDYVPEKKKVPGGKYITLLSSYQSWLELKRYKKRGIDEKLRIARQFCEYVEEHDKNMFRFFLKDAEHYREYLRLLTDDAHAIKYDTKTVNLRMSYLKVFYTFLISIEKTHSNPFENIDKMKVSDIIPRNILSIKQMEALLGAITVNTPQDFKFKVIVELLYGGGLRVSELEHLRYEDVKCDEGYIIIRDDKTRKDRVVILNEYSCSLLQLYIRYVYDNSDEYIFTNRKSRVLNVWINNRLKKITKKNNIPEITCHGIRHSIATHLIQNGADLREVQEFLGHKQIQNTEVYTRIFPEDLKAIIEKTHPRESGNRYNETE